MAGDPHIELRVSRLENDRNATYDLITDIQSVQQEHSRRFDAVDRRFDAVDHRLDAIDHRLEAVDATLAEILRRLPAPS